MTMRLGEIIAKGLEAREAGNYHEAEKLFMDICAIEPCHPDANYNLGLLAVGACDFEVAVLFFKTALQANPRKIRFWVSYIEILIKLKRIDDAKRVLKQAKDKGAKGEAFDKLERNIRLHDRSFDPRSLRSDQSKTEKKPFKTRLDSVLKLFNQGMHENVLLEVDKAIQDFPVSAVLYNIQGASNYSVGKIESAIVSYKKAIEIQPNSPDTYNNLAISQKISGDIIGAINSYKTAIELKHDMPEGHFNLGTLLQSRGELKLAGDSYNQAMQVWQQLLPKRKRPAIYNEAVAGRAECMYGLRDYEQLYSFIEEIAEANRSNIRLAALSVFFSDQTGRRDLYPFCKNPLEMIAVSNIAKHFGDFDEFNQNLLTVLADVPQIWEPGQKGTHNGFQTTNTLFSNESVSIKELEKVIKIEIDGYYSRFKSSSSNLIQDWPKLKKLAGWHVRMIKGGYQDPHIHAAGWLSGVVYLKTLSAPVNSEGAIEFSLHDGNFEIIDRAIPRKTYQPRVGDIILFPSSLFHRTIKYSQEEERSIVAFDLLPQ